MNIYVSTYDNADVFEACLRSFLCQSHSNLHIYVFDDGPAEGIDSAEKVIQGLKDRRVTYEANPVRFGMPGNDIQIIDRIDPSSKAMMMAGDVALSDNAVEVLLSHSKRHSAQVVRSSGQSHAYQNLNAGAAFDLGPPLRSHDAIVDDVRLVNSGQLLEMFFGPKNIAGEFFSYSFYGSLFDGALLKNFEPGFKRYVFHGFEQYLSMLLALVASRTVLTPEPLLHDVVGQPRSGGHYRPVNNISRWECHEAGEMFLERNFFRLNYAKVDVDKLKRGLEARAKFLEENFSEFHFEGGRILWEP